MRWQPTQSKQEKPGGSQSQIPQSLNTDQYPGETTWSVVNDATGETVMSGGPYGTSGTTYTSSELVCANSGCFTLTINDSFGDGICCGYGDGSYSFTVNGEVVAAGGSFTNSESTNFCVEPSTLEGFWFATATAFT